MNRFNGNRGGVLKILLIIFGVIFVCVIGVTIYIAMNWKSWTADFTNLAAQEIIKESGLPEDQKQAILSDIKNLGEDFKTGRVSTQEMVRIMKSVEESPLIPLAAVQTVKQKYLEPSSMTAEEKAAAVVTVQRYARGVHEKKIPRDDVEETVKPIAELHGNGHWTLKENPTRMEIDQFLANAKAKADAADIPNEPYDLNIAEELRKAIRVN
jgi:hypothetical protein